MNAEEFTQNLINFNESSLCRPRQNDLIDRLTYLSWKAQIALYGMSFENARKLYKDAIQYEEVYRCQHLDG